MDLGIAGKRAVVCASSKGLGLGCAEALAQAGVHLVMNARGVDALEAAAEAIRAVEERFSEALSGALEDITTVGPKLRSMEPSIISQDIQ